MVRKDLGTNWPLYSQLVSIWPRYKMTEMGTKWPGYETECRPRQSLDQLQMTVCNPLARSCQYQCVCKSSSKYSTGPVSPFLNFYGQFSLTDYGRTQNFTNWLQTDTQTDHGQITKKLTEQTFSALLMPQFSISCLVMGNFRKLIGDGHV